MPLEITKLPLCQGDIVIRNSIGIAGILIVFMQAAACLIPSLSGAEEPDSSAFHRYWPDNLFAVEFIGDNVGFIAGYSGSVLRTTDGGSSWDFHYIGRNELIRRVAFADSINGWAVGHRGTIFHTKDGGDNWEIQKELPGIYLRDIDFVDEKHGWVVGHEANIWHTSDGGESWRQQQLLGFKGRDIPRLHGIYAKDIDNAILVGEFGVVAHTENGGDTWLVTPLEEQITWLSVDGKNGSLYAVGLEGSMVRLTVATAAEREGIDNRVAQLEAEEEARARKKAERRKRQYVPKEKQALPHSDVEYVATSISTGTTEHLFDIAMAGDTDAIAVGRSTVLKVSGSVATPLQAGPDFPLPFVWLGGVAVTPDGTLWSAGIRGLVIDGNVNEMRFDAALSLGGPNEIKLSSSRWGDSQ
jgi:hypothetical protein